VLIGSQLLRCSAHSVRPVTDTERVNFEVCDKQDATKWKSFADVLPQLEYLDIIDQATGEDERELPDLPDQPDESTAVTSAVAKQATKVFQKGVTFSDPALQPRSKIVGKQALTPADWKPKAGDADVELLPEPGSASQPSALAPAAPTPESPDLTWKNCWIAMSTTIGVSPRHLPHPKKQKVSDDKDMRTMLLLKMNTLFSTTSSGWRNYINQMMDFWTFTIWLLAMIWTASPWSLTWALFQSGSSRISSEALLRILSKRCEIPKWFSANCLLNIENFLLVLRARKPTAS
jgi:hypothetical protein